MVVNYKEVDDFVTEINDFMCSAGRYHSLTKSDFDSIFDKIVDFCTENKVSIYVCYCDYLEEKISLVFSNLRDARFWRRESGKDAEEWIIKVDKLGNSKLVH